jgi:hypothetical protein
MSHIFDYSISNFNELRKPHVRSWKFDLPTVLVRNINLLERLDEVCIPIFGTKYIIELKA